MTTDNRKRVLECLREAETLLRGALLRLNRRADSYEARPGEPLTPAAVGGQMAEQELETAAQMARQAADTIDETVVLAMVFEGAGS